MNTKNLTMMYLLDKVLQEVHCAELHQQNMKPYYDNNQKSAATAAATAMSTHFNKKESTPINKTFKYGRLQNH